MQSKKITIALVGLMSVAMSTTMNLVSASANAHQTYTVKLGDTLSSIATNNHTTVAKLQSLNKLVTPDLINAGTTIKLSKNKSTYTVKLGDTLGTIAESHHLSVDDLRASNNLVSDVIVVGQVLKLTKPTTNETPVATVSTPEATTPMVTSTSDSETSAKAWIANKESGGNYNASNNQYYGRYQLNKSLLNGDYSPSNQEQVANNYVTSRYGSWVNAKAFWQQNGWY